MSENIYRLSAFASELVVESLETLELLLHVLLQHGIRRHVLRADRFEQLLQIERQIPELVQELDELQVFGRHHDSIFHGPHELVPFLFYCVHTLLDVGPSLGILSAFEQIFREEL